MSAAKVRCVLGREAPRPPRPPAMPGSGTSTVGGEQLLTFVVVRDLPALQQPILACDCEGVNLGRLGRITLIQVSSPEVCVLFDVADQPLHPELLSALKEILEDDEVCQPSARSWRGQPCAWQAA